jgi:hypothetical protein
MQDNGGRRSRSGSALASVSYDQIELLPTNGVSSFEVETIGHERKGQ